MRLLDRYLLRELLVPLGFCLGAFLLMWISFDLFNMLDEFYALKLRGSEIALYYAIRAPEFIVMVLPMALLLALLYTLTNLARHHETTAMRAAGVSLWRLALPYFGVGLAASAVLFGLNEYWVPDTVDRAEEILNQRAVARKKNRALQIFNSLDFVTTRDGQPRRWHIGVYDAKKAEMRQLEVDEILPDGARRFLFAERAIYTNNQWLFLEVKEFVQRGETNSSPVPTLVTNALVVPALSETPEEIRSEIRIGERLNPTLRKARMADVPLFDILDYLRLHPNPRRSDRSWLFTKLHGRLAAPWTCIVVVLIALPFGVASGRRNVFVGVASSIVICFAYFVLLQLGLALGAGGYVPAWLGAWLPNLCFGGAGLWMTARVR